MSFNVKITFGGDAKKGLNKLKKLLEENKTNAMKQSLSLIEKDAKKLCPVDTGRLRASISYDIVRDDKDMTTGRVGTNVKYGPPVEFGTKYMRGRSYLFAGLRMNIEKIKKILGLEVEKTERSF